MSKPTMNLNEALHGIELKFDGKPSPAVLSELKDTGWFWHYKKKIWYTKQTPERIAFAQKLCGIHEEQSKHFEKTPDTPHPQPAEQAEKETSTPNTFAASYDKVGDAAILKSGDVGLLTYLEAFCEKEQLSYKRTRGGDSITLRDLSNAQKAGKICPVWRIYPALDADRSVMLTTLLERAGVDSITKLFDVCNGGHAIEDVVVNRSESKGVDLFSPFVEVKPLTELPEKWTKRNFTQALMSGQLFRAETAFHYTDDYAYDAAFDFRSGTGLDMPTFVSNEVGDWNKLTTCYNCKDGPDKTGAHTVNYSVHSNHCVTLWFDVNCDIAEGKRRAEQRETAVKNYNAMMESSCIDVAWDSISPEKVYQVESLDMNTNTGTYGTKQENLQGDVLRDRLDPDCPLMKVLSVKEMEIHPDVFYSVSNFHRRLSSHSEPDDRIIPLGNFQNIVSGKALLELTAEGRYFPHIADAEGSAEQVYEKTLQHLTKFANGTMYYGINADPTDYAESIQRVHAEYQRAGGLAQEIESPAKPLSLADKIKAAQALQDEQASRQSLPTQGLSPVRT